MQEQLQQSAAIWPVITHLGAASLLLPVLLITCIGLWRSGQQAAVRAWLGALTLAVVTCLITKVAYIGWGIGVDSIDFTGISGHTLFATSVLPVLFHWLATNLPARLRLSGVFLGLALSVAVAVSRVVLHAHSVSEVVLGWLLGLLVCMVAIRAMKAPIQLPRFARIAPLALLFAFDTPAATYLPTHSYEIKLALFLSGHDTPYQRR